MERMIPTSADIYLEINGRRVAVVQSYSVTTTRSSRVVEAFGQEEPVATIAGSNQYAIELSRLYATDEALADGISFHDLMDFSLVICKPDRQIVFSGCQWARIDEQATLGDAVMEKVHITAAQRVESIL